jgi:hypothetical protein
MGATAPNLSEDNSKVNGEIDNNISLARRKPVSVNALTSMALRLT